MLFGEIITIYCENRTKPVNTLYGHFPSPPCSS